MERLPTAIETVLFRVLQESLTNIHRHSGSLSADVHLEFDENLVSLQIKDRGRGMPAALVEKFQASGSGIGVGLAGMRERLNELGGRLELESDSQGTLVRGTIPLGPVAFTQEG
jgi:signal transduction histidine kinase